MFIGSDGPSFKFDRITVGVKLSFIGFKSDYFFGILIRQFCLRSDQFASNLDSYNERSFN